MNKVIILGAEVADVGPEEALGIVRQMVEYHAEPPLTPPPPSPSPFAIPLRQGFGGQEASGDRRLRGTGWKGGDCHYITTPNPEIALAARKDKELRSIINKSFLALADGFGLKIAAWILGQKLENRIGGADFMLDVCALAEREGWPVFLLGGMESHRTTPAPPPPSPSPSAKASGDRRLRGTGWKGGDSVADHAGERLRRLYPDIKVVGAESGGEIFYKGSLPPPFAPPLARGGGVETTGEWVTSDENIIDKINKSGAKVLFVGFGCPKQEKWLCDNLSKLTTVKLAMTVGGTFDYLAGRVKRAPFALRRLGLEWLWRLFREPRRAGRIWNATARFMWQVIKWRWRMAFSYRRNVAGFIVNNQNKVLIVKRAFEDIDEWKIPAEPEHWQLPQGGVEKGESDEEAVKREMREEVGLVNLRIIGRHPKKYRYDWPGATPLREGRRGQKQTIFYLRFTGNNNDVRVDQKEHNNYRWAPITQVLELVHSVRQPMTKMAVEWYLMSLRAPSPTGRRGEAILQSR